MAKISWSTVGSKIYQAGVDRGVLYREPQSVFTDEWRGYPWEGLISITDSPTGGELTPHYIDGVNYRHSSSMEQYGAQIEAYTYPREFEACNGYAVDTTGLGYDLQPRRPFGLSYRTLIGNETTSLGRHYKIHIIYNAVAMPSEEAYTTLSDSIDPLIFSWNLMATTPEDSSRFMVPTPHLVVDTRQIAPEGIRLIENMLYGTTARDPRLPSRQEIVDILGQFRLTFRDESLPGIYDLNSSLFPRILGDLEHGVYILAPDSDLDTTSVEGIYEIAEDPTAPGPSPFPNPDPTPDPIPDPGPSDPEGGPLGFKYRWVKDGVEDDVWVDSVSGKALPFGGSPRPVVYGSSVYIPKTAYTEPVSLSFESTAGPTITAVVAGSEPLPADAILKDPMFGAFPDNGVEWRFGVASSHPNAGGTQYSGEFSFKGMTSRTFNREGSHIITIRWGSPYHDWANDYSLVVNGEFQNIAATAGSIPTSLAFRLGSQDSINSKFFREVRIYDERLSDAKVVHLHQDLAQKYRLSF